MIDELMELYENSKQNDGEPECVFAETLIFNEGWLLRSVLEKWRTWNRKSIFPFLPFPNHVKIYSEGQLYTPFKKIEKISGKYAEDNTHVDGIVGNFSIVKNSKSGIELDEDFKYLAVFESKMYSTLSKKVTNAKNYNQISRTISCIINSIIKVKKKRNYDKIHFIVTYPIDNDKIKPKEYHKEDFVKREIEERLRKFEEVVSANPEDERYDDFFSFKEQWEDIFKKVNIHFVTWEDILSEFEKEDSLYDFYKMCKTFNRKKVK